MPVILLWSGGRNKLFHYKSYEWSNCRSSRHDLFRTPIRASKFSALACRRVPEISKVRIYVVRRYKHFLCSDSKRFTVSSDFVSRVVVPLRSQRTRACVPPSRLFALSHTPQTFMIAGHHPSKPATSLDGKRQKEAFCYSSTCPAISALGRAKLLAPN